MAFKDFLKNPLSDLGNYDSRVVGRDAVRGFAVSTCWTHDEGFETAVIDEGTVYIVERYKDLEEAGIGHERWCGKIRDGIKEIPHLCWSDYPSLDKVHVMSKVRFVEDPEDES